MLAKRAWNKRFVPTAAFGTWMMVVVLGATLGLAVRGPEGVAWIFALLLLSATVVSIAQQTLP